MFEIIIIIIFIVVIAKRIKNFKQDGGMNGSGSMPNTTVTAPTVHNNPVQPRPAQTGPVRTIVQNRPAQAAAQTRPTQAAQQKSAQSAIQEAKEDGHSTTAYLMEKAEADAREHAKEKFEEQKRLYETRGGLAVAERYLEGDSIPQGKRCVNCGYCGAENLIPMIPRTKYSCYFCREPL